jgi:hypothetical protein
MNNPSRMIIGIDPGLSGAIGVIKPNGNEVIDIPVLEIEGSKVRSKSGEMKRKIKHVYDITAINQIFINLKTTAISMGCNIEAWLEKSQAMPDQGGVSNFNYGVGFGILQTVLICNKTPMNLVHPVSWKKKIMFGQGKEKDAAVYKASQLFPELTFRGPRGGLMDGRAEAMLIAEYGKLFGNHIENDGL